MGCCTPKCKKWTLFSIASVFLLLGVILVASWGAIYRSILNSQLTVSNKNTMEFTMWKETPIPMYIEFYLFNWTNHEEVLQSNWSVKPRLQECGPYTYSEKHIREQIKFNNNHTVTYKTNRIWHFLPEKSGGSLQDEITSINSILAAVGNAVKDKHQIVDLALNFLMEEKRINFTVTKTATEWLFDGYDDPMLDLVHKLNITAFHVPFKKFGWFVERNGSVDYDGVFTMFDGSSGLRDLGKFTLWNGASRTEDYGGYCGMVNGTSGELWYPVKDDHTASIFSPDTCSTLTLTRNGTDVLHGVEGHKFIGTAKVFDNGTNYPEMACFSPGVSSPSGVRNVSQCKFGAPAFVSFPHFYLADPYYTEPFEGLKQNKTIHQLFMSVEPETGIPLRVQASMQLSMKITRVPHLDLLSNVKEVYFPTMWFRQTAVLSESLASQARLLLVLPSVGQYTGYGIIGVGGLLFVIGAFITFRKGWGAGTEESPLLSPETL